MTVATSLGIFLGIEKGFGFEASFSSQAVLGSFGGLPLSW